jgi:hypothetical protein
MLVCSLIPPEGKAADRGPVDHRFSGPGLLGKSRLKAPAQFGARKDIHIPHSCRVNQNRSTLCCRAKAIILTENLPVEQLYVDISTLFWGHHVLFYRAALGFIL